jgi:hypothetical protein
MVSRVPGQCIVVALQEPDSAPMTSRIWIKRFNILVPVTDASDIRQNAEFSSFLHRGNSFDHQHVKEMTHNGHRGQQGGILLAAAKKLATTAGKRQKGADMTTTEAVPDGFTRNAGSI